MKLRFHLGQRGMTLMELLVGLSLSVVAGAVVYTVFVSTQGSFSDTRDMTSVQSDARVVLGMLTREIRGAGSDPNNVDSIVIEPFAICHDDSVRLQSDFDGNGILDADAEPPEDVTWYLDAGASTLVRRTPNGELPVLLDVSGFEIEYLDTAGNALTSLPLDAKSRLLVRALRVNLSVRLSDASERTWTSTVALRNDQPTL